MQARLFLDEDSMSKAMAHNLRLRGIDVTTVAEVGRTGLTDLEQIEYATSEGRIICTGNVGDFFQLHTDFLTNDKEHSGIIIIQRQGLSIGEQLRRLLRLIKSKDVDSMRNNLEFLSNW